MAYKNELAQGITRLIGNTNKTELAQKLGVSRQAIYDWCRTGNIKDDHLFTLCNHFGVDPFELKYDTAYKSLSIDAKLLTTIVTALEEFIKANRMTYPPSDYATTVATLYDIYKNEIDVSTHTVSLALKAMAAKI